MAQSKCGHCGNFAFEVKEVSPNGARFKYFFIQCTSCGVPVTAVEFLNIGAEIGFVKDKLDGLEKQIKKSDEKTNYIGEMVERIYNHIFK